MSDVAPPWSRQRVILTLALGAGLIFVGMLYMQTSPLLGIVLIFCGVPLGFQGIENAQKRTWYKPEHTTLAPSSAPDEAALAPTKVCPDCAETVLADARICRFCRHEFEAGDPSEGAPAP